MKTNYFIAFVASAAFATMNIISCTKDTPRPGPNTNIKPDMAAVDRDVCANAIQIRLVSVSGGTTTEPEFSVYNSIEPWGYIPGQTHERALR